MSERITATLAPRTWGVGEPWVEIEVEVKYVKRTDGIHGYTVVRADTGHKLGQVTYHKGEGWSSMSSNDAYYPADADILERLDKHPSFRGDSAFQFMTITTGNRSRALAAGDIIWKLLDTRAEAVEDLVAAARAPFLATLEAAR